MDAQKAIKRSLTGKAASLNWLAPFNNFVVEGGGAGEEKEPYDGASCACVDHE